MALVAGSVELTRELEEVEDLLRDDLLYKVGHTLKLAHIRLDPIERQLLPALVLISSRLFQPSSSKSRALAGVMQLIYLAFLSHHLRAEHDPALPVLVGDYFYAQFFDHLARHDCLEALVPLAQLICALNETQIRRVTQVPLSQEQEVALAEGDWGNLCAQACYLGAETSGAPAVAAQALREFGNNLGQAWRLGRLGGELLKGKAVELGTKALKILRTMPTGAGRDCLEGLLGEVVPGALGSGS